MVVIVLYIILLAVFALFASFIIRHIGRYHYLSPHFRVIAAIFGVIAALIIGFSLYLIMQLHFGAPGVTRPPKGDSSSSNINF